MTERNRDLMKLLREISAQLGVRGEGVVRLDALSGLLECRGRRLVPPSGSVIVLLLPYFTGQHPKRNVSLYAIPDDYHRVAGVILEKLADLLRHAFPGPLFQPFVDNSPIPEVEAAVLAGLGFRGRNGQLITPEWGSMVFICELVTDLLLEPTGPLNMGRGCGDCRLCLKACPTGALQDSGFDCARCRSFITQKKGELNRWEAQQIARGGFIWGCDLCTVACPYNKDLPLTPVTGLRCNLQPWITDERLDAQMTEKSYIWRGKAVLRRNLALTAAVQQNERK